MSFASVNQSILKVNGCSLEQTQVIHSSSCEVKPSGFGELRETRVNETSIHTHFGKVFIADIILEGREIKRKSSIVDPLWVCRLTACFWMDFSELTDHFRSSSGFEVHCQLVERSWPGHFCSGLKTRTSLRQAEEITARCNSSKWLFFLYTSLLVVESFPLTFCHLYVFLSTRFFSSSDRLVRTALRSRKCVLSTLFLKVSRFGSISSQSVVEINFSFRTLKIKRTCWRRGLSEWSCTSAISGLVFFLQEDFNHSVQPSHQPEKPAHVGLFF